MTRLTFETEIPPDMSVLATLSALTSSASGSQMK
jgi:hypothetical protein